MSARGLDEPYPSVATDDDATIAARLPAEHRLREKLTGLTVTQWLPRRRFLPPTVGPDASIMHIAALMARTHTPLVAVVESDGDQTRLAGAVSAARLMEQLVGGP